MKLTESPRSVVNLLALEPGQEFRLRDDPGRRVFMLTSGANYQTGNREAVELTTGKLHVLREVEIVVPCPGRWVEGME